MTIYFPWKQYVQQYSIQTSLATKKKFCFLFVCLFHQTVYMTVHVSNKMHCFPAHISAKHNICKLISMVLSMFAHPLNPHSLYLTVTTCVHISLNAFAILSAVMQIWVRNQTFHWKKS